MVAVVASTAAVVVSMAAVAGTAVAAATAVADITKNQVPTTLETAALPAAVFLLTILTQRQTKSSPPKEHNAVAGDQQVLPDF
jgi:hypothetical protein